MSQISSPTIIQQPKKIQTNRQCKLKCPKNPEKSYLRKRNISLGTQVEDPLLHGLNLRISMFICSKATSLLKCMYESQIWFRCGSILKMPVCQSLLYIMRSTKLPWMIAEFERFRRPRSGILVLCILKSWYPYLQMKTVTYVSAEYFLQCRCPYNIQ